MKTSLLLLFLLFFSADLLMAQSKNSNKKINVEKVIEAKKQTTELEYLKPVFRTCNVNGDSIYYLSAAICSKPGENYPIMRNYYDLLNYNQPDEQAFQLAQNFALHPLRLNYRSRERLERLQQRR